LQDRVPGVTRPMASRTSYVYVGGELRWHPEPVGAGPADRLRTNVARRPHRQTGSQRKSTRRGLLRISAVLAFAGCATLLLLFHKQLPGAVLFDDARAHVYAITGAATSSADGSRLIAAKQTTSTSTTAANIVAQGFGSQPQQRAPNPVAAKAAGPDVPPARVAALGNERASTALQPRSDAAAITIERTTEKTALVDFETAPFPYQGNMPGTNQRFLNVGQEGHRGHSNFRGKTLWEPQTYNDDRALLHIPPGFDPKRPAVMVVFFHGHGAELARDVRDRQQLPAQVTEGGINAVLVAPQFAFDAADSSAGKFWELNGFKRFLDEAVLKLAGLYGDPRSAAAFANMPIIIVAYSGGFGPTLAVLERGGVRGRVRGLVLLDALYAGTDKFADWIANNRSAFFISSYTTHTAHQNADLENLLRKRSVSYSSELRHSELEGMVTFLPTGAISHRDFVTHAWANDPVRDILARMNGVYPKIQTASMASSTRK
jgi:hypothetical protein